MSSSSQHSYTGCYFIACFSDTSAVVPREVHLPKPVIYVNLNTNLSRPSVLEQELENMGNATYESYPTLNNFVFLCKECRVCRMFHWAPAVNLHTVKNLKIDNWEQVIIFDIMTTLTLIPLKLLVELKASVTGKKSSGLPPTLNSRLPLLLFLSISGCWKEMVSWAGKLNHIIKFGIFNVHLPQKSTSPGVHRVISVAFCHVWCSDAMRNRDSYHHILNDDDGWCHSHRPHHTCNSRSVFSSSYSMLTSQPPEPLSLGQQLIDKGISESSLLVNLNMGLGLEETTQRQQQW